jgi:hypothetical protein
VPPPDSQQPLMDLLFVIVFISVVGAAIFRWVVKTAKAVAHPPTPEQRAEAERQERERQRMEREWDEYTRRRSDLLRRTEAVTGLGGGKMHVLRSGASADEAPLRTLCGRTLAGRSESLWLDECDEDWQLKATVNCGLCLKKLEAQFEAA